jgi:hypothetical protein
LGKGGGGNGGKLDSSSTPPSRPIPLVVAANSTARGPDLPRLLRLPESHRMAAKATSRGDPKVPGLPQSRQSPPRHQAAYPMGGVWKLDVMAPGRIGRARQRVNASTRQQSDLRLPAVRCASTRQRVNARFQLFQSTKPQPGHWKPQCQTTAWPLECPKSLKRVNASTRQRVNASSPGARFPQGRERAARLLSLWAAMANMYSYAGYVLLW